MKIQRITNVSNREYRDSWVESTLEKLSLLGTNLSLLDVGAGEGPYKQLAIQHGFEYQSHDFNKYQPQESALGFQDPSWIYPEHTYVCDILDIPENITFDVLLCTEVFEHIPDPVAAFKKIVRLVKPGGHVVVTVPLSSHIHQSPFYFSSGLSPFWFMHWSDQFGLEIETLSIQGDYVDRMRQDIGTLLNFKRPYFVPGLARAVSAVLGKTRTFAREEVLNSTGFGTIYIGKKPKNF